MPTTTITWHPVANTLPDDDTLVLLSGGEQHKDLDAEVDAARAALGQEVKP